MATVSLAGFSNQAPGTRVTTRTAGALFSDIVSFSTAYILVEAPDSASAITFPYNVPVQVINLDDYTNLIGGVVPSSGPALVSYNSLKLLFRNAGNSLVYVVRVGGAFNVQKLSFPVVDSTVNEYPISAIRGTTLSTVSPVAGDTIYYRIYINNVGVGEYTNDGTYLGVPFTLPETIVSGSNHSNSQNALLSDLLRDQVLQYIQNDPAVYASTYIRSFSTTINNVKGHNVELSPRIIGQSLDITFGTDVPSVNALFYNPVPSDVLESITPTNVSTVADYIQAVQTAFRSEMDLGYIAAPAAFAQFEKLDRKALGIAIENFCSDPDFSWLGIIDPGNSDIGEVELSVDTVRFDPAENILINKYFEYDNTIWKTRNAYTPNAKFVNTNSDVRKAVITDPGLTNAPDGAYANVSIAGGTGCKAVVKVSGGQVVRIDIAGGLIAAAANPATSQGSNYGKAGTTVTNVPVVGGSGYGARANFVVNSAGRITQIDFIGNTDGFVDQAAGISGAGYKIGDVLTVDNYYFNGRGAGFSYVVKYDDVELPAVGSNYVDGAVVGLGNLEPTGINEPISAKVKIYTSSTLEEVGVLAGQSQFIPANPGNPLLDNGLLVNGKRYSLPLKVVIPTGALYGSNTSINIPTTQPLTPESLVDLENGLSELVSIFPTITLEDGKSIIESLVRSNSIVFYDSGVDSHAELLADSQQYTSPFGYIAYYGPYLLDLERYLVPPSCGVIGVALRRTAAQGFQEPPAGVVYPLQGVLQPEFEITRQHQLASNPRGMNAIRELPGNGTVIWGARTRSSNPLFKFVNTRVILNVIIGTARRAFDTLILSSVDGRGILFGRIRETLEQFLYRLWQGNALFGENPKDAFRVFCDRRNNPAIDLESGRVRANIYVVPVPTLEAIEIDLVRAGIDQVQNIIEVEGFN